MTRVLSIVPRPWSVGIVVMESPTTLLHVELLRPRDLAACLTTRAHDMAVQALNVFSRFAPAEVVIEAAPLTFGAEVSIYEYATAFGVMFGEIAQKTQAPWIMQNVEWAQYIDTSHKEYAIAMASEYPSYAAIRYDVSCDVPRVLAAIGMARWWLARTETDNERGPECSVG